MRKLVVVLGVPIDDLNLVQTLERLDEFIQIGRATGKNHQVATVNLDFLAKAKSDPELRHLLQEADMSIADGMPIVWAARALGVSFEERVAGSDLIPLLAERAAQKDYSIYLLGAGTGIAQKAADVLQEKHPNLRIVGVHSPPYSSVLEMDSAILADIRAAKPDILLVAFGNPKQEKWIGMHRHALGVPVMVGVGATLDFIAGYRDRAPHWMRGVGLEWLYRLLKEPRRLWRRYVVDLFVFATYFVQQWWVMRRGKTTAVSILPETDNLMVDDTAILRFSGRITIQNHQQLYTSAEAVMDATSLLIFDMSKVTFLDSTAIGTLIALTQEARDKNKDLWLAEMPETICKTIKMLNLENYFYIIPRLENALAIARNDHSRRLQQEGASMIIPKASSKSDWTLVIVPRRFDADTADSILAKCESNLAQSPFLVLDFSETVFLASAGLAVLSKLHHLIEEKNGKLRLVKCSNDVKKVIRLVRFDQFLSLHHNLESAIN